MRYSTYDYRREVLGNRGRAGIDAFFHQHSCGAMCDVLGLAVISPSTEDHKRPPTTISSLCTADDVHSVDLKRPDDIDLTRRIPDGYSW